MKKIYISLFIISLINFNGTSQNNNISSNTTLTDQISTVKKYFTDKGYSVNISTNASTGNTLQWKIKW